MKITVYYSPDADTCAQVEVQPTDSIKSVKQKIMAMYAPPEWANAALLAPHGTKDYFGNKLKLSQCNIEPGSNLKFVYARNLTQEEKVELNMTGVKTEQFDMPQDMIVNNLPPQPLPSTRTAAVPTASSGGKRNLWYVSANPDLPVRVSVSACSSKSSEPPHMRRAPVRPSCRK